MAGTLLSPPRHSFFSDPPPFSKFETENCTPPPTEGVGWGGEGLILCVAVYIFSRVGITQAQLGKGYLDLISKKLFTKRFCII